MTAPDDVALLREEHAELQRRIDAWLPHVAASTLHTPMELACIAALYDLCREMAPNFNVVVTRWFDTGPTVLLWACTVGGVPYASSVLRWEVMERPSLVWLLLQSAYEHLKVLTGHRWARRGA